MIAKLFELRDRGTFIPALAIKLDSDNEAERWLLRRAGFSLEDFPPYVLLGNLDGGQFNYDQYDWGLNGTKFTAQEFIREHFDELDSGSVICTEFIRGERPAPKISERLEVHQ